MKSAMWGIALLVVTHAAIFHRVAAERWTNTSSSAAGLWESTPSISITKTAPQKSFITDVTPSPSGSTGWKATDHQNISTLYALGATPTVCGVAQASSGFACGTSLPDAGQEGQESEGISLVTFSEAVSESRASVTAIAPPLTTSSSCVRFTWGEGEPTTATVTKELIVPIAVPSSDQALAFVPLTRTTLPPSSIPQPIGNTLPFLEPFTRPMPTSSGNGESRKSTLSHVIGPSGPSEAPLEGGNLAAGHPSSSKSALRPDEGNLPVSWLLGTPPESVLRSTDSQSSGPPKPSPDTVSIPQQNPVGSKILAPGGPTITVSEGPISLAPSVSCIVIESSTIALNSQPRPVTMTPTVTVGSQTITANLAFQYMVNGQTLVPGGSAINANGTLVSLAPGASDVVVGSSTGSLGNVVVSGWVGVSYGGQPTTSVTASMTTGTETFTGGAAGMDQKTIWVFALAASIGMMVLGII